MRTSMTLALARCALVLLAACAQTQTTTASGPEFPPGTPMCNAASGLHGVAVAPLLAPGAMSALECTTNWQCRRPPPPCRSWHESYCLCTGKDAAGTCLQSRCMYAVDPGNPSCVP